MSNKRQTSRVWDLRVERKTAQTAEIVAAYGRITWRTAGRWRAELEEAGRDGRPVVVDLAGVDYISGAGLAALQQLSARARTAGQPAVLSGVCEAVRVALELAGVLKEVTTVTTRDDALRILSRRSAGA